MGKKLRHYFPRVNARGEGYGSSLVSSDQKGSGVPTTADIIRENVRRMMDARGITARQLSRLAGLSDKTVLNFLDGSTSSPGANTIGKVAAVLGVTATDLMRPSATEPASQPPDGDVSREMLEALHELRDAIALNTELLKALLKNR